MSKTDLFISELLSNYETKEISENDYLILLEEIEGHTQKYIAVSKQFEEFGGNWVEK